MVDSRDEARKIMRRGNRVVPGSNYLFRQDVNMRDSTEANPKELPAARVGVI